MDHCTYNEKAKIRVYLVKKAIERLSERRTMDIYYYRGQEEKVKA